MGLILALLAVLTMISGALSGLLAASRFLFAMAKDGLLPNSLDETNNKFETPHWSIIITAVTMAICILTLPVKDVAKLASGFQIMVIVALNVSVIVLRKSPSTLKNGISPHSHLQCICCTSLGNNCRRDTW